MFFRILLASLMVVSLAVTHTHNKKQLTRKQNIGKQITNDSNSRNTIGSLLHTTTPGKLLHKSSSVNLLHSKTTTRSHANVLHSSKKTSVTRGLKSSIKASKIKNNFTKIHEHKVIKINTKNHRQNNMQNHKKRQLQKKKHSRKNKITPVTGRIQARSHNPIYANKIKPLLTTENLLVYAELAKKLDYVSMKKNVTLKKRVHLISNVIPPELQPFNKSSDRQNNSKGKRPIYSTTISKIINNERQTSLSFTKKIDEWTILSTSQSLSDISNSFVTTQWSPGNNNWNVNPDQLPVPSNLNTPDEYFNGMSTRMTPDYTEGYPTKPYNVEDGEGDFPKTTRRYNQEETYKDGNYQQSTSRNNEDEEDIDPRFTSRFTSVADFATDKKTSQFKEYEEESNYKKSTQQFDEKLPNNQQSTQKYNEDDEEKVPPQTFTPKDYQGMFKPTSGDNKEDMPFQKFTLDISDPTKKFTPNEDERDFDPLTTKIFNDFTIQTDLKFISKLEEIASTTQSLSLNNNLDTISTQISTQHTALMAGLPKDDENSLLGTDGLSDYGGEYDLKLPIDQLFSKLRKLNGGVKINQRLISSYDEASSDIEHLKSLAAYPESFQADVLAFGGLLAMLDGGKKILIAKDFNTELFLLSVDLTPSPNLNKNKEKILQYLKHYKTFFKPLTQEDKQKPEINVPTLINTAIKIKNPLIKSIAFNSIFHKVKQQISESE